MQLYVYHSHKTGIMEAFGNTQD